MEGRPLVVCLLSVSDIIQAHAWQRPAKRKQILCGPVCRHKPLLHITCRSVLQDA